MQTVTFEAPALYGDHHVTEVHRILSQLPGVKGVYASSAFHVIEVTYDPQQIKPEQIRAPLEAAGYLQELPGLVEVGAATPEARKDNLLRHTAVYEATRQTISFARQVPYQGRPLWPCPGMGIIKKETIEK